MVFHIDFHTKIVVDFVYRERFYVLLHILFTLLQ